MIILTDSQEYPEKSKGAVVAVGNFDGVHLGHMALIKETKSRASAMKVPAVIYTFMPHPASVIAKGFAPRLLQTFEQKMESLQTAGIDICIAEKFTRDFSEIHSRNYFQEIILQRINPRAMVVGYNFTFGLHREGTAHSLSQYGTETGIEVIVVEPQSIGEAAISSTNIRNLIFNGEVAAAEKMLGRHYSIRGKVISGKGIGGKLGAHTANIDPENEIIPKNGVYITETSILDENEDASSLPSITSIGNNPTFGGGEFAIETHIIDSKIELSKKRIEITFLERLDDQIAFQNVEDLRKKIADDIEAAKKYHAARTK